MTRQSWDSQMIDGVFPSKPPKSLAELISGKLKQPTFVEFARNVPRGGYMGSFAVFQMHDGRMWQGPLRPTMRAPLPPPTTKVAYMVHVYNNGGKKRI